MRFQAGMARAETAGRKRGTPNKITKALKEMILEAAELAGGEGGVVAYLKEQAKRNPQAFMSLLGKVLPLQIQGDSEAPLVVRIERTIIDAADQDGEGLQAITSSGEVQGGVRGAGIGEKPLLRRVLN